MVLLVYSGCVCLCTQVACEELGIDDLAEVFEWIELEQPIGSASISQVNSISIQYFNFNSTTCAQHQHLAVLLAVLLLGGSAQESHLLQVSCLLLSCTLVSCRYTKLSCAASLTTSCVDFIGVNVG